MGKSSKVIFYKQCRFASPTENGVMGHIAWVPEKFAELGRVVYFGKKRSNPDRYWKVTQVSNHRVPEDYLIRHERDWKTQRQASDI